MMRKRISYMLLYPLLILVVLFVFLFAGLGVFSPQGYQVDSIVGEQTVQFPNGKIRYHQSGNSKHAILLLHGFNGAMNQWDSLWQQLQSCGTVVRMDIPGFGDSQWDTKDYSIVTQGKRIIQLLDKLGIETVTLVGVSMGGTISGQIAADYPSRVTHLIMLAPSGYPGSLQTGIFGSVVYQPGFSNRFFVKIAGSESFKFIFQDSRALQALSVTASYGENWLNAIIRITQKTVIFWSKNDSRVLFENADYIQKLIAGSELVIASDDAGHNIIDFDTELLVKQICKTQQIL